MSLQLKEGRKEGERKMEGRRKREKEKRRRKRDNQYALKLTREIHRSLPTQNWDSVIVSSVRCTLKRQEFVKGNPRIDFMLSFTSALDNINYKLFQQLWPSTQK